MGALGAAGRTAPGDWYARGMYEQGSRQNKYHVAHYGPPSKFGYKDIIPLWKAEKWDPEKLMALYKKAGAKYFVSMGSHHDNFFLWKSQLHKWNAFNMGPHKDVVGAGKRRHKKRALNLACQNIWQPVIPVPCVAPGR
nr:alpha-L-fucosidase [Mucilaginibacter humi]